MKVGKSSIEKQDFLNCMGLQGLTKILLLVLKLKIGLQGLVP